MIAIRPASNVSATSVVAAAVSAIVLTLATAVAWGDVGHGHAPDEGTHVPGVVWLLGRQFGQVALCAISQALAETTTASNFKTEWQHRWMHATAMYLQAFQGCAM